jgi:hypothetical protein
MLNRVTVCFYPFKNFIEKVKGFVNAVTEDPQVELSSIHQINSRILSGSVFHFFFECAAQEGPASTLRVKFDQQISGSRGPFRGTAQLVDFLSISFVDLIKVCLDKDRKQKSRRAVTEN